jgi:hypothetical protein
MAELSSEEWNWKSWVLCGSIGSMSPLASVVALSLNIGSKASLDKLSIKSQVHWSAEITAWDQFFTVGPVATG